MEFSELTITHYDITGLFSNCSVMLGKIIDFYNQFFREPNSIDSSNLFYRYKSIDERNNNTDITHKFFKNYKELPSFIYDKNNMVIDYHFSRTQFSDYRNINLCYYKKFINKYFSPSDDINDKIKFIENKYNLDYDNICVLFYRGNDKCTETFICEYDRYIQIAKKIYKDNPSILFLIQSDETEFIDTIMKEFPNNSFYFKDEIVHINKDISTCNIFRADNVYYGFFYLAITIIMARCKFVVCNTSNCSLWIMLYRNNTNYFYQDYNNQWFLDYH